MKRRRAPLPEVSEQMKAWSSALAGELADWPQVETRSFFGFTALYRRDRMFAALPRTRSMTTPSSLLFKLEACSERTDSHLKADSRIGFALMGKNRWFTFELSSDTDLHDALDWIGLAYDAAGKPPSKRSAAGKSKKSRKSPRKPR